MAKTRIASIDAAALPYHFDIKVLPPRVDRKDGAAIITKYFFPVSWRTLESWRLPARIVCRRALYETADLVAFAQAKLDNAPLR